MSASSQRDLSLKALELFEICAAKGSLKSVAVETGLSVSTISHHLRKLEEDIGVDLFNHARRPLVLTTKGQVFLSNIEEALLAIRRAKAEASSGDVVETSHLRVGSIEDFDSDILPELAVYLSKSMERCRFVYQNGNSNTIIDMLRDRQLDLGVVANPTDRFTDLKTIPLLRDPYVVAIPESSDLDLNDIVHGRTHLQMLRFSRQLIIAKQIEAHLRRSGVVAPHRFECDNNLTLMAMVADGAGWTITTPLLYARAKRFHSRLKLSPFPGKSFSRSISIVATPDCSEAVLGLFKNKLRELITLRAIQSVVQSEPWLKPSFELLGD